MARLLLQIGMKYVSAGASLSAASQFPSPARGGRPAAVAAWSAHGGETRVAIGIETNNGKMTRLIPKNPTLPTKKTHVLTTFWDKRSTVTIKVFQGDRSETKHCSLLGQLHLSDIPTASIWNWGRRDIEVILEADEYGELRVEATDRSSGKSESAMIYNRRRQSREEIDQMFREAEAFRAQDELEAYVRSVMDAVGGRGGLDQSEVISGS